MLFPSLCIGNFFKNPDNVVNYAKTFKYTPSKTGKWPGKRTESLHLIAPQIHRHVGRKVLATLFPNNYTKITYDLGDLYFQKISSDYCNTGWVHVDDPAELTVIIYLSKHRKCGTSIFNYVKAFPTNDDTSKKKFNIFLEKKFKEEKEAVKENNIDFEETVHFSSRYNRAVFFDSSQWHAAQQFAEQNIKEDRLTLVGFYYGINFTKFPVSENNRI